MKRDYDGLTSKVNELNEYFSNLKNTMNSLESNYSKISASINWNAESKYYFQTRNSEMSNNVTTLTNRILEINNYLDNLRGVYYRRKKADEELWESTRKYAQEASKH